MMIFIFYLKDSFTRYTTEHPEIQKEVRFHCEKALDVKGGGDTFWLWYLLTGDPAEPVQVITCSGSLC